MKAPQKFERAVRRRQYAKTALRLLFAALPGVAVRSQGVRAFATMSGASMTNTEMLEKQSWAVIGDVLHPTKPARAVAERLEAEGKTVSRVNPRGYPDSDGILFKDLRAAHAANKVDVIDLIINSRDGLVQMQQAAELGIKAVWIQPGAGSAEILALCKENGIAVYEGCVLIETPGGH